MIEKTKEVLVDELPIERSIGHFILRFLAAIVPPLIILIFANDVILAMFLSIIWVLGITTIFLEAEHSSYMKKLKCLITKETGESLNEKNIIESYEELEDEWNGEALKVRIKDYKKKQYRDYLFYIESIEK